MNLFKNILFYCISALFLTSCRAQGPKLDTCKKDYKIAKQQLNLFYKDSDSSHLLEALDFSQKSERCEETRSRSIDLKTSLFVLLKRYNAGANFIDSLKESDFKKEYKKQMYFRFFTALEKESNGDTITKKNILSKIVEDIRSYIEKETPNVKEIDKEAWYDLFFIEKKYKSMLEIKTELDSLKIKYPATDFFTDLKQSFQESQTAEAKDSQN